MKSRNNKPASSVYVSAAFELFLVRRQIRILDIFLPGPNGLAFLHELRSFSDTGDIPVIIWTTATMKDTLDQFSPYGVTAVIDKSLATLDELVVAIKKAVRV